MEKKGSPKGQKKGYQGGLTYNVSLDQEQAKNYDVSVNSKNHLRQGKLYDEFCILNQEFMRYVLSLPLTKNDYRILMFLLSYMDHKNKIIIDGEMIEYNLGINQTHVNKHIKKLEDHKLIYKRNLGYRKGKEVLINFDVISPHMAYKDSNGYKQVQDHKEQMRKDVPYIRQHNMNGEIDYVNNDGEVFHTKKIK